MKRRRKTRRTIKIVMELFYKRDINIYQKDQAVPGEVGIYQTDILLILFLLIISYTYTALYNVQSASIYFIQVTFIIIFQVGRINIIPILQVMKRTLREF